MGGRTISVGISGLVVPVDDCKVGSLSQCSWAMAPSGSGDVLKIVVFVFGCVSPLKRRGWVGNGDGGIFGKLSYRK